MSSNSVFRALALAGLILGAGSLQGCAAVSVASAAGKVVGTTVGVTAGAVSMVGDAAFDHDGDGK